MDPWLVLKSVSLLLTTLPRCAAASRTLSTLVCKHLTPGTLTTLIKPLGLFAPRIGQQYRDEQRRRRSQFDRGTIAAEREATWLRSGGSHRSPPRFYGHSNMMSPTPNRSWYGSPFNRRV